VRFISHPFLSYLIPDSFPPAKHPAAPGSAFLGAIDISPGTIEAPHLESSNPVGTRFLDSDLSEVHFAGARLLAWNILRTLRLFAMSSIPGLSILASRP
jgi:hypothetical protein